MTKNNAPFQKRPYYTKSVSAKARAMAVVSRSFQKRNGLQLLFTLGLVVGTTCGTVDKSGF